MTRSNSAPNPIKCFVPPADALLCGNSLPIWCRFHPAPSHPLGFEGLSPPIQPLSSLSHLTDKAGCRKALQMALPAYLKRFYPKANVRLLPLPNGK